LPVDLEELAGILEGDPLSVGGRIDIRTGEVWPQAAIEYARRPERKTRTPPTSLPNLQACKQHRRLRRSGC
jgi:hypothetical protein